MKVMNPLPKSKMSNASQESRDDAEHRDRVRKIIDEDRDILDALA